MYNNEYKSYKKESVEWLENMGILLIKDVDALKFILEYGGIEGYEVPLYYNEQLNKIMKKNFDRVVKVIKNHQPPYIALLTLGEKDPEDYMVTIPEFTNMIYNPDLEYFLEREFYDELKQEEENRKNNFLNNFMDFISVINNLKYAKEDNYIVREKKWPENKFLIFMKGRKARVMPQTPYGKVIKGMINIEDRFDLIDNKKVYIGWMPSIDELLNGEWKIYKTENFN